MYLYVQGWKYMLLNEQSNSGGEDGQQGKQFGSPGPPSGVKA